MMKRVLHISDLHFGRIHPPAAESLEQFIKKQAKKIDLVAMTGDWTQRARKNQYQKAAVFIQSLQLPVLSVPGNHDIPLYNWFSRLWFPFKNYDKYIKPLTTDQYQDDHVIIMGLNTVSFSRTVEGRIHTTEVRKITESFSRAPAGVLKVIACHHPVYDPRASQEILPKSLVNELLQANPHVILSGHSHLNWTELINNQTGHPILHISAGSAISSRLRGEANSFHMIEFHTDSVDLETYFLSDDGFIVKEDVKSRKIRFQL